MHCDCARAHMTVLGGRPWQWAYCPVSRPKARSSLPYLLPLCRGRPPSRPPYYSPLPVLPAVLPYSGPEDLRASNISGILNNKSVLGRRCNPRVLEPSGLVQQRKRSSDRTPHMPRHPPYRVRRQVFRGAVVLGLLCESK